MADNRKSTLGYDETNTRMESVVQRAGCKGIGSIEET